MGDPSEGRRESEEAKQDKNRGTEENPEGDKRGTRSTGKGNGEGEEDPGSDVIDGGGGHRDTAEVGC